MTKKMIGAALLGLAFSTFLCVNAHADTLLGMNIVESQPLNDVWITSGYYSRHFNRDKDLQENNYGLGAEYHFSTVSSLTAGRFYNSGRQYSNYAGIYYQPVSLGPFKLGAVIGGFNGYPNTNNGGWFLAAIPVASAEWGRLGLNIAVIPTIGDKLHGAISLQLKLKVWD